MPKFSPPSFHSEDWWKSQEILNSLAMEDNADCVKRFGPDTWIAWAVYWSEAYPPLWGYPTIFPTATDCLMWLRWYVIPDESGGQGEVASEVEIAAPELRYLADLIDGYPDGTRSDWVLAEVLGGLRLENLNICKMESIHGYLSSSLTPEEMRFVFADPGINRVRGRWLLADEQWEELGWCWQEYPDEAELSEPGRILFRTMLHHRSALTLEEAAGPSKRAAVIEALQSGRLHGVQMNPSHFLSFRTRETRDDDWLVIDDEVFTVF